VRPTAGPIWRRRGIGDQDGQGGLAGDGKLILFATHRRGVARDK
jgi:hypothetical protein